MRTNNLTDSNSTLLATPWERRRLAGFSLKNASASLMLILSALILPNTVAWSGEYGQLETELNHIDQPQDWRRSSQYGSPSGYQHQQPAQYGQPQSQFQQAALPPVTPTPQSFAPARHSYSNSNNYMRPGMPYSNETIPALQNSVVWRNMANPGYSGPPAGQAGGNPFNLSPFGVLHYLWDDTTYVSSANPVTLYQTQNELQTAQQYSNMAQAAATRAKYASSAEERAQAVQQAQYYAGLAKQAAQTAQQVSQSGSLNPSDVAAAAEQQAQQAQNFANQARGF